MSIEHGDEDGKKTGHTDTRKDLTVCMIGIQCHCTLPHVKHSLRNADHEKTIGFTVIITCKTTQQLCKAGIIRSSTNETHSEDGVDGDVEITVMRVSTERFKHRELWIRSV